MSTIVRCEKITKSFGKGDERFQALRQVNLEIMPGEFVVVMGPSGSGKSTLMYILSGIDQAEEGKVHILDHTLSELSEKELSQLRRTQIGFVFQQPTLLRNLNLLDNILLPALADRSKETAAINQKARNLMEKTGIASLADREVSQASGGQLQRAGICRALINDPPIIFADEPTGALNSTTADSIMDLLTDINREDRAILLVTHDPKVAIRGDRLLFMVDGQVVEELHLGKYRETERETRLELLSVPMKRLLI